MRIILQHELELLKQQVLAIAKIKVITPAVFRELSSSIQQATKKQVSNSTLKRIFGFAAYSFQPSLYTLNVLAEYCGYESWVNFSTKNDALNAALATSNQPPSYYNLQSKALETSLHTLQSLKIKSGIPFTLTIPRELLNEHLEIFMHTEYPLTVLSSPAGYGKTIALCHWVEEKIQLMRRQQSKDVLLFINSKALSRTHQQDQLQQWLLSLSGIYADAPFSDEALRDHLLKHKFYLVLDGLDSTSLSDLQLDTATNMLLDTMNLYKDSHNFKVIITMRSATWINFQRQLMSENRYDQCFPGFMADENNERNFTLFTPHEIKQLANKIKPGLNLTYDLHREVFSLFSYPPFFQYYYQRNAKSFALNELDVFDTYKVIHSYILDNIYTGRYCTEKVLLIHAILKRGRYRESHFCTDKIKIYEEIARYNHAYNDLISIGVIREINLSNDTGYIECIDFVHDRILTYCMATKLIYDNHDEFNDDLIHRISCDYNPKFRLQVLKWCIYTAIKNKQFHIFNYLPKVQLVAAEKATLILFLSKLIEQGFLSDSDGENNLPFDISRPDLFNYFFGVEFISFEYEKALRSLLKLNLQDVSKIWIYTCLGIIHLLSLNAEGVEECLNSLKEFPPEVFLSFQINPLYCIETLFYYMKYNIIKTDAIADITRFIFNPYVKRHQLNKISSNHILYMLALCTLYVTGNPRKVLRFIKTLFHIHHSNDQFLPEFHFFLLISKSNFLLEAGRTNEAVEIFKLVMIDFTDDEKKFTPYMKASLEYLAARLLPYMLNHAYIDTIIAGVVTWPDKDPYRFLKVNALSHYLSYNANSHSAADYQSLYFKYIKLIRSTSFDPRCFVFNYREMALNNRVA